MSRRKALRSDERDQGPAIRVGISAANRGTGKVVNAERVKTGEGVPIAIVG